MKSLVDARRMWFASMLVLLPVASAISWTILLEFLGDVRSDPAPSVGKLILARLIVFPTQISRWSLILWLAFRRPLSDSSGIVRVLVYVGAFFFTNACVPLVSQLTRHVLNRNSGLLLTIPEDGILAPQSPVVIAIFASVLILLGVRWWASWTIIDSDMTDIESDLNRPRVTITKLLALTLCVATLFAIGNEVNRSQKGQATSQSGWVTAPTQVARTTDYKQSIKKWTLLGVTIIAPVLALTVFGFRCGGWRWLLGPIYYVVGRLILQRFAVDLIDEGSIGGS